MKRRDVLGAAGAAALAMGAKAGAQDHGGGGKTAMDDLPPGRLHLALCAFHVGKADPTLQVEAHHFCAQVAEGVHQCIIYDSRGKNAKLLGVEYIVSNAIYASLPDAEKAYYHPHTYEITSGQLVVPGMPEAEENQLMAGLITTWGKTWHTWPDPKSPLPMGDPILMWSFTKDGQCDPKLIEARDAKLKMSTDAVRKRRAAAGLGKKG